MSRITPKQLLNHEGVEELVCGVISNSISYVIIQIAEYAVKSEDIMKEIGSSLEKIFKIYKNPDLNLISRKPRKPIPELKEFWHNIPLIPKYKFEKLDEELLFKGPEYPIELIKELHIKSKIYGKTELYKKSIEPAEKKINNLLSQNI